MSSNSTIEIDRRDAEQLVGEILARRPGYLPEWRPGASGADIAIVQAFARYVQAILQRLNQAPAKNKLAFLDTLGVELIPARAARAPVYFTLQTTTKDVHLPKGTRVAAPPPPERTEQVIFETERAVGLAVGTLKQVVSLWPGRDQFIDHSGSYTAGTPIEPFALRALENTPHHLYIAHDVALAMAGSSHVSLAIELSTASSEALDALWEYWDGVVWREFLNMRAGCDEKEAVRLDSTEGFTRSGRVLLETECAVTSQRAVNGVNAFWIRACLRQPLPPDPMRVLPEIDRLRIATEIRQPLVFTLAVHPTAAAPGQITLKDEAGTPVIRVVVDNGGEITETSDEGVASIQGQITPNKPLRVKADGFEVTAAISAEARAFDALKLTVKGLKSDQAFSGAEALDTNKPFFPFGQQPQPGDVFYITNKEAFSKPGANVQVYLQTAKSPYDEAAANLSPSDPLLHHVAWEYWNGASWSGLLEFSSGKTASPKDLTAVGVVSFTIPDDFVETKVNEQAGLWVRVRLLSGTYGFTRTISQTGITPPFKYVATRPPLLSRVLLGYTWQQSEVAPAHVVAFNDFQYTDRTNEATWPGSAFQPFTPVKDATPGLYLGFDKPLPNDRLGIYFSIAEKKGETEGPALVWESWNGGWEAFSADDETHGLRLPGMISFIGPEDSEAYSRFDRGAYHWLRARLKEDGPPGSPAITGLYPNAVWTAQHQTVTDEPIGASTGAPNQVFRFRLMPVIEQQIEIRELNGLRANVEWRILARELFRDNPHIVFELEAQLANEVTQTEVERGPLRLVRDRAKRVVEAWVKWDRRRHLLFSGSDDRHYTIDRARGWLLFGDGIRGRTPPVGAAILARMYRTGGGVVGNVRARTVTQLLGPIGGIESVSNPVPAEGGADGETLEQVARRGPRTIHHRGRGISARDYETLAIEASPAIAVAHAIGGRDSAGRTRPGWVTLIVIPRSTDPRPWPSFGLRDEVRQYIEHRAPATLVASRRVHVTGPLYTAVDVIADLVPKDPADAGDVEQRARDALATFLHPLLGGVDGQGWPAGRSVYLSDIAAVLGQTSGLDFVFDVALAVDGELKGNQAQIPPDHVVVAGEIKLKLLERRP